MPIGLAMQGALVYVLTQSPPRLIEVDGRGRLVLNWVKVAEGSVLVTYDGELNRVITVSTDGVASVLHFYEPLFLNPAGQVTLPTVVNAVITVRGQLWAAGNDGLYRIPPHGNAAVRLPEVSGTVWAAAADPTRNRLLATVGDGPSTLIAVSNATGRVLARSPLALGKVSVAVDAGTIWLGGYGGPKDRKVVRLDPATLAVVGTSPVDAEVGPGATVWAGEDVVWVRSGGSEGLACIATRTGAVQARWPSIQGPVVSSAGLVFAPSMGYLLMLQTLHTSCQVG
jgi:hypothetical protein